MCIFLFFSTSNKSFSTHSTAFILYAHIACHCSCSGSKICATAPFSTNIRPSFRPKVTSMCVTTGNSKPKLKLVSADSLRIATMKRNKNPWRTMCRQRKQINLKGRKSTRSWQLDNAALWRAADNWNIQLDLTVRLRLREHNHRTSNFIFKTKPRVSHHVQKVSCLALRQIAGRPADIVCVNLSSCVQAFDYITEYGNRDSYPFPRIGASDKIQETVSKYSGWVVYPTLSVPKDCW